MKNIRISTLIGDYNYGNRLQNYALSKKIEEKGYEVKTLNYQYTNRNLKILLKNITRNVLINLNIGRFKRERNFKIFNRNIKFTKAIYLNDNIDTNNIDYFVTGSDQVWNYNFATFSERDLLLFSEYNKNISYAASFGIEDIPEDKVLLYKKGLNNIKAISVRENSGKDIVKKITGKEASVLIDPTMLLKKEEWAKLERKPKGHKNGEYIVVHILGDNINIDELKKKYDMNIVVINDRRQPYYYNCGPSEYLYLIHNAKLVITDSFHACVFSIIYKKPFYVYDRVVNGKVCMEGRINTLLTLIDKKDRKINDILKIMDNQNVFEIDTSSYDEIIEKEIIKAEKFLDKALEI